MTRAKREAILLSKYLGVHTRVCTYVVDEKRHVQKTRTRLKGREQAAMINKTSLSPKDRQRMTHQRMEVGKFFWKQVSTEPNLKDYFQR